MVRKRRHASVPVDPVTLCRRIPSRANNVRDEVLHASPVHRRLCPEQASLPADLVSASTDRLHFVPLLLPAADTYFTIVDLHAITMPHEPRELLEATRRTAALYLAAGIDPDRASVFVQSHVPAHSELAWLLQCYTPVGWLRKLIQFKEKSRKQVIGAGSWG